MTEEVEEEQQHRLEELTSEAEEEQQSPSCLFGVISASKRVNMLRFRALSMNTPILTHLLKREAEAEVEGRSLQQHLERIVLNMIQPFIRNNVNSGNEMVCAPYP